MRNFFSFTLLLLSRFGGRYWQKIFQRRNIALVVFGVVLLLIGLRLNYIFSSRSLISEGIIGTYTQENLPPTVTSLLSDPLVGFDNNGHPQPVLSSSWQVNNNATVYTFKLRENVSWSDGTIVKSSDIKFNIPDVEVSYPDDQTIEFKLADSFSAFPSLLTSPVLKGDTFIGMGKYRVVGEEYNRSLITKLVLQPRVGGSNKDNPSITIRFYPDEGTAKTALKLGEVDSILGVPDMTGLADDQSILIKKVTNYNKIVAIFYNFDDSLLSDKNLRKALSLATFPPQDEQWAKTSIPPYVWAYNDQIKGMSGDTEAAKSYLKKVQNDQSSSSKKITLTTTTSLSALGEKIVQSWKEIGISAVLRVESGIPQNFQALLVAQSIPSDPDQYSLWHSTQTKTNLSKYRSQRADKDLEDGRKMADLEKRKEKYLDFQKVLLDDSPATFLYFPKTNVIYRSKIGSYLDKVLPLQIPVSPD